MEKKKRLRLFILPLFVIILGLVNYTRLTGTEHIRAIHIVTLITIGMGLGVLLSNVFTYFRRKGGDHETMI
jgi:positive regulator of sigma E activity